MLSNSNGKHNFFRHKKVSITLSILLVPIQRVRLYRKTARYGGEKPGPKKAPHSLLPEEKEDIINLAKNDKYMDLSHRQLSVVASETGEVEASASSFYRVMKQERLMEDRQRKPKTPQAKPEVNPDGPNQVWSWDLTYIALGPIFIYMFAIIDVCGRKTVGPASWL